MNKLFSILFLVVSFLFSGSWVYEQNNPWDINMEPRGSSLGGIDLYSYVDLNSDRLDSEVISIFNSSMFNSLVEYNNIYYKKNINSRIIMGNSFNKIKIGFFNRVIDDIKNTNAVWDSDSIGEPILSELNYDLIDYYEHKDIGLSMFLPFSNSIGDFGLDVRYIYSSIDTYKSNSVNMDFMYLKNISDKLHIMISLNNMFSYRKWTNQTIERFYPALEFFTHFKIKNSKFFLELDNIYLNQNFIANQYDLFDNIKIGFEQSVNSKLRLRFGHSNDYETYGFGLLINDFMLDYCYLNHESLDYSSQFSITYLIK